MPVKSITKILLLKFCAMLLTGCAGTSAPYGYLSPAGEAQKEAYGAWISMKFQRGTEKTEIKGEFIALQNDSVFVLARGTLIGIPVAQIAKAKLTTYSSRHGLIALWTLLGTLSSGSHGMIGVISLPVWIITGTLATAGQSYAPIEKYPLKSWYELKKYARFPQGLPSNLDRTNIQSKPKMKHYDRYR